MPKQEGLSLVRSNQMSFHTMLFAAIILSGFVAPPTCFAQSTRLAGVNVRIVTDEADAVLAILAKKKAGQSITEADWQQLFSSEGYIRLKQREAEMQRAFEDEEFKSFVLSEKLAGRAQALESTLAAWKHADMTEAGRRALAYLKKDTRIRAKIYPMIKPRENSFVFDVKNDPAIFLYLDPGKSKEIFETELAHELHHIGYISSCPSRQTSEEMARLPQTAQNVLTWVSAFGEGFAVLAAAGGVKAHPHAASLPEDRARWDREMTNVNEDFKKVEKFFVDVLENRLTEEERVKMARSFYGVQGPWYTVGWKMAVTIEKAYGRAKLIECMCDQRKLLSTYNKAAAKHNRSTREPLALWSSSLVKTIGESKGLAHAR
ncbi:MAG: hypothetical protein H0U54_15570 [Acidobacteria bacterium]|nr:hypothetical protein [Acidobacteriota bacterium]